MILVDTSVLIDYVRGKDAKLASLLPTLSSAVCGIVRAELLCGARDPPFGDVVIATVALDKDIELWTRDAQFGLIQRVLPALKLFQEPP